jgi:hypothetical protein
MQHLERSHPTRSQVRTRTRRHVACDSGRTTLKDMYRHMTKARDEIFYIYNAAFELSTIAMSSPRRTCDECYDCAKLLLMNLFRKGQELETTERVVRLAKAVDMRWYQEQSLHRPPRSLCLHWDIGPPDTRKAIDQEMGDVNGVEILNTRRCLRGPRHISTPSSTLKPSILTTSSGPSSSTPASNPFSSTL